MPRVCATCHSLPDMGGDSLDPMVAAMVEEGEQAMAQRAADRLVFDTPRLQALRLKALRKEGEATIARRAAIGEMLQRHLAMCETRSLWPTN